MITTLKRLSVAALTTSTLIAAGLVTSESAHALTFDYVNNTVTFNTGDVGESVDIFFRGGLVGDEDLNPNPFPTDGLQGIATFLLSSFSGGNAVFNVTIENNSVAPVTAAVIKALAFNTDPNLVSRSVAPGGIFSGTNSGNVPNAGNREICFTNNNCAGGGPGGIGIGGSGSLTATLGFGAAVTQFTLSDFVLRYQEIDGTFGGTTVDGASGISNPGKVPTPALLPGLLGLGVAALRKRQQEESGEQEA